MIFTPLAVIACFLAAGVALFLTRRFADDTDEDEAAVSVGDPSRREQVVFVAFAGALLSALTVATAHGNNDTSLYWWLPVVGVVLVPLVVIDFVEMQLPVVLNNSLFLTSAAAVIFTGIAEDKMPLTAIIESALLWMGVIGLLWFLSHGRAMGFGDVRLAPSLGLLLGWFGLGVSAVALFMAFLCGATYGIGKMLTHRASGRTRVPFGPFLILGACLGLAVGHHLVRTYMSVAGLS